MDSRYVAHAYLIWLHNLVIKFYFIMLTLYWYIVYINIFNVIYFKWSRGKDYYCLVKLWLDGLYDVSFFGRPISHYSRILWYTVDINMKAVLVGNIVANVKFILCAISFKIFQYRIYKDLCLILKDQEVRWK